MKTEFAYLPTRRGQRCCAVALLLALQSALVGCGLFHRSPLREQFTRNDSPSMRDQLVAEYEARRAHAQYQAALSYWHHGDTRACREHLESLLERQPRHHEARLLLLEVLLDTDALDAAQDHAEEALAQMPDDRRTVELAALVFEVAGDDARAAECRQLVHHPAATKGETDPHTLLLGAEICLATGHEAKAAELLAAARDAGAPTGELAAFAERLPRPVAGKTRAPSLLATPELDDPQPVKKAPDVASSASTAVADDTARSQAASALTPVTDETPANNRAGSNAPASRAGSAAGAPTGKVATPLVREELRRGEAALSAGVTESAAEILCRAIELSGSDDSTALAAAVSALRHGEPEIAAQLAEAGIKRAPRSAALYRALGTARYQMGDYSSSEVALRQALSLDNSSALAYFLMGSTLEQLGRSDAADWHYRRARQLDPRYAQKP